MSFYSIVLISSVNQLEKIKFKNEICFTLVLAYLLASGSETANTELDSYSIT